MGEGAGLCSGRQPPQHVRTEATRELAGFVSEMREAGRKRIVISFIAAISACEKSSSWENAMALPRETP